MRTCELGTRDIVIKPTVSAGSRNTGLFRADDANALALVASILEQGKTPMIMDALPDVALHGERSLVVFDGKFSHAARKAPILAPGGGYLGGENTETITPDQPLEDEIEVSEFCIEHVRRLGLAEGLDARTATPLYARIDIARGPKTRRCWNSSSSSPTTSRRLCPAPGPPLWQPYGRHWSD